MAECKGGNGSSTFKGASVPTHTIFAGRLLFLNIGLRSRHWKQMGARQVVLSAPTHVNFKAARVLADLARTKAGELSFVLGSDKGAQVRQDLAVFCSSKAEMF